MTAGSRGRSTGSSCSGSRVRYTRHPSRSGIRAEWTGLVDGRRSVSYRAAWSLGSGGVVFRRAILRLAGRVCLCRWRPLGEAHYAPLKIHEMLAMGRLLDLLEPGPGAVAPEWRQPNVTRM